MAMIEQGERETGYVRNTWYPAAWSRDVTDRPAQRRILGEIVALYRGEAGGIFALEDSCPHRLTPLSMGRVKGSAIECGYHGLTFDGSGQCIRIPGQRTIPGNAKVRSYPVAEKMGLIWIWMGDPALADPGSIYNLPQFSDSDWSSAEGDALHIACNYLNLADNLCDPAHVSFVHLSTLGNAAGEDIPVESEKRGEDYLVTWRWIIDAPAIPLFQKFGNFTGNVDRWHYYHYHAPSIAVIDFGSAVTGTGAPEGSRDNCIQIFACHFITPVDEDNCIDHWLHVKNFKADDDTNRRLSDQFRIAFNEDKDILEAIHRNEKEPRKQRPLRIAIDAAPIRMRRMVDRMIKAEQGPGNIASIA
jgi:phenylpropionate dioxygenase-like ring-hydroxylating dioxygenase large terminal subunit